MTIRKSSKKGSGGFTLIDALVAIVVLATGILALTLLQTRMLRATAEARDRSEATVTAQNLIERVRADSIRTVADYTALASQGLSGGACNLASSSALKLNNQIGAGAAVADFYRYCVNVTRYWACPSGQFTNSTAVCAQPTSVGFTAEYKQVELTLGWRDGERSGSATTDWHTVVLGDAISGIPLANSNELQNRPLNNTSKLGGAQVRYPDSFFSDESNFIPIAVGNNGAGQRIAATNPTPEVTGGGVAETSYQIFTYQSQLGSIQVQRQIDTKAAACTCQLQSASATPTNMLDFSLRPSYWDGRRYTAPANVQNQQSYLRGVHVGGSTESDYCDICCRDHHDPSGFDYNGDDNSDPADDRPKFDPYTTHDHWLNGVRAVAAGQQYKEVCRVVRVDGVYRVTPDPAMEHFAFLPPDNDATSPTTEDMAKSPSFRYNTFVRDFVKTRLNLTSALSGYSASGWMSPSAVKSLEDASTVRLNEQAGSPLLISSNDVNSPLNDPARYLQDRVVVMDALEYQARKVIQDAINNPLNTSCATDPLPCVLANVPFASVNLTPLTLWDTQWVRDGASLTPARTLSKAALSISPQDVLSTDGTSVDVYAGQVGINPAKASDAPTTDTMLATISRSVTALVERFVLFPTATQADADAWRMQDSQPFEVTDDPAQGLTFQVKPSGLTYMASHQFNNSDAPDVRWVAVSGTGGGICRFDSTDFVYNCFVPQSMLVSGATPSLTVQITNYHQKGTVKNNDTVSCSNPAGGQPIKTQYPVMCSIWRAAATATVGSTTVAVSQPATPTDMDNPADDMIAIAAGSLTDGQVIGVGFSNPVQSLFPGRTSPTCNTATGIAQNWVFTNCRMD